MDYLKQPDYLGLLFKSMMLYRLITYIGTLCYLSTALKIETIYNESYRSSLLKVWQLQNIMINNGQAKVVLGMMYQRVGLVRGELVQFTV